MTQVTRLEFARACLAYGNLCRGPEYEQCLIAVFTAEGSKAAWNPADTTLGAPNATPYNSFGPANEYHVWNYPTGLEGVHTTIATMVQANMHSWYQAMRKPNLTGVELARAFSQSPWGGFGDTLPLEVVDAWNNHQRDYVKDREVLIAGEGPWPFDTEGNQLSVK